MLQDRWRDGDCRAKWYKFGINLVGYSKMFDKPFKPTSWSTWFGLIIQLALSGISIWKLVDGCSANLEAVYADQWYEDFNFLSEDRHPTVSAGLTYSTVETVIHALLIAVGVYNSYSYGKSQFYYGTWGLSIGKLVTEIFVSADAWAGSGIIVPTKPWVLYDAQVPDATTTAATTTTSTIGISAEVEAEIAEMNSEVLAGANATVDSTII